MPFGNPPICPKCGLSDRAEMAKMSMNPPVLKQGSPKEYVNNWPTFWLDGGILLVVLCVISYFTHFLFTDFGLFLTLFVFIILCIPLWVWVKRGNSSQKAEVARYNSALAIENATADKVYREALYHYNNDLYICRRDGTVFIHDS